MVDRIAGFAPQCTITGASGSGATVTFPLYSLDRWVAADIGNTYIFNVTRNHVYAVASSNAATRARYQQAVYTVTGDCSTWVSTDRCTPVTTSSAVQYSTQALAYAGASAQDIMQIWYQQSDDRNAWREVLGTKTTLLSYYGMIEGGTKLTNTAAWLDNTGDFSAQTAQVVIRNLIVTCGSYSTTYTGYTYYHNNAVATALGVLIRECVFLGWYTGISIRAPAGTASGCVVRNTFCVFCMGYGIYNVGGNATYQNNIVLASLNGFAMSLTESVVTNCAAAGIYIAARCFGQAGTCNMTFCISDDATADDAGGAGCQINIPLVSMDVQMRMPFGDAASFALWLGPASVLSGAGTNPGTFTQDRNGTAFGGVFPVGCCLVGDPDLDQPALGNVWNDTVGWEAGTYVELPEAETKLGSVYSNPGAPKTGTYTDAPTAANPPTALAITDAGDGLSWQVTATGQDVGAAIYLYNHATDALVAVVDGSAKTRDLTAGVSAYAKALTTGNTLSTRCPAATGVAVPALVANSAPAEAEVSTGVTYRVDGTGYTGSLVIDTPAAPVLAVADNGLGTGATATISGATALTTNTVFTMAIGGNSWTSRGSRTGNGTVAITVTHAAYWAKCESTNGFGTVCSNVVLFIVTDPDDTVVKQLCDAVATEIAAQIEYGGAAVTATTGYLPDMPTAPVCAVIPDGELVELGSRQTRDASYRVKVVTSATCTTTASMDLFRRFLRDTADLFLGSQIATLEYVCTETEISPLFVMEEAKERSVFVASCLLVWKGPEDLG